MQDNASVKQKKKELNKLPAQEEHVQHNELGAPEQYKIIL